MGQYGGYGSGTRLLARGLAERGIEVSVVTPRRGSQRPVEVLDGVPVYSYPPTRPGEQIALYRRCDADVYHVQEPNLGAVFARRAMPQRRHVVTCRYVRRLPQLLHEARTYLAEGRLKPVVSLLYEHNPLVASAVRRADAVTCVADFEGRIAHRKYRLERPPILVPSPFRAVPHAPAKAVTPTACFVGRWERRKNPEAFFDLAREVPEVSFIAAGQAQNPRRDAALRRRYAGLPNLALPGFVDQFSAPLFDQILSTSWILVNTSDLEGLPITFLEAASAECAILSRVDPDGFASRFGYCARSGDFATGLRFLIQNGEWRRRGRQARAHLEAHGSMHLAIARQIQVYQRVLDNPAGGSHGKCRSQTAGRGRHAA